MASREAMNMGSRSSTVISEFKSVIASLGQATDSAFNKLTSARLSISGGGGGTGGGGGSLVAPNPVFNSAPQISYVTETGSGLVTTGSYDANRSSNLVARGPANLSTHASQTGAATLYQPEVGSISGGGSSGKANGIFGGRGGAGGGGAGGAGGGSNPFTNLTNIPIIGASLAAGQALYNTASNLTPSTSDILEAQLLQQRASFFAGGTQRGVSIVDIQKTQQSIANDAMLSGDNPQMDVMRAQIAAQGYGLGGPNANKILQSAANVSNLMPGLGVEGSVRATAAMQQANNVNMLRGIGIQLRGTDGSLKGPDEVIEEVWKKLCRDYSQAYGASKSPSLKEVQISLQPGNALDSMLNQYFGNDPMLKQLVANGLIFKAQGGGNINKQNVADLGGTTSAMLSYTSTAASGQGFLVDSQAQAASGFVQANQEITKFYETSGMATALSFAKAFGDTLLTAFGGSPLSVMLGIGSGSYKANSDDLGNLLNFFKDPAKAAGAAGNIVGAGLSGVFNLFTGLLSGVIPGMATGGEVTSGSPYIIGEKGPELFVPSSSGTIVPNNQLGSVGSTTYNITINATSGVANDIAAEVKKVISQIETNRRVSEA